MSEGNFTNLLIVGTPVVLPRTWQEQLVWGSIEDSNNLPASATLRYRDQKAQLLEKAKIKIGSKLRVQVRTGDRPAPVLLFTGEVVTLETEFDGTGTFTTIRALDQSHRLMRGRKVASFLNQKASEIARKVASGAGLSIGKIDPTSTVYEMVTQPNITDWEFLKMLAVDNDAEVTMVDGKFYFRDPVRATSAPGAGATAKQNEFVVQMNENLLSVRSTVTAVGQQSQVEVRGWDVRKRQALTETRPANDSDEIKLSLTPKQVTSPFGMAEMLVTDVPYGTQAEVKAVARALAAQVTSGFAELEVGIRGNPKLRAGVPLALTDVGKPFEGKYTITASRHVFGPGLFYETWLTVSGGQDRSIAGLASGASAPARAARVPGLAIGVVTDTKAGLGRDHPERRDQGWVKLRFPWLSDKYESDWVRTVQLGGVGGGGVISPEVGDEVLVGFEQGLLDRPFVLGGLYNGVDDPSKHDLPLIDPTSGEVNRRSLASRKGGGKGRPRTGNWIELLDGPTTASPQGVRLRTEKGSDKLLVHLDRAGTSVVVRSDGSVVIEAKTEVTIEGTDRVSVTSKGPIELRGKGIKLDAGLGDVAISGKNVSVNGTTGVSINGGMVRIN